jgi:hypothetical protein
VQRGAHKQQVRYTTRTHSALSPVFFFFFFIISPEVLQKRVVREVIGSHSRSKSKLRFLFTEEISPETSPS